MCNFTIRNFGAVGDGVTLDTGALQKAIDACHAAGGGTVLCPPGKYLVGSFELRSHVNLHVQDGATLLASGERRDYVTRLPFDAIVKNQYHGNFDEALVYAADADGVSITGRGTIDGNGRAFFFEQPDRPGGLYGVRDWRPGMLVSLIGCRNVLLRDIQLVDAPCYTLFPLGCSEMIIDGVTIRNDRRGPNTDGIDLHCCRNVRISNCCIDAGDDCITCYSMPYWLENPQPCENITVTNCTLSGSCCGVRIGYAPSDLPVRNLVFSNLVIQDCQIGIDLLCPLDTTVAIACEGLAQHGPTLENIVFNSIVMDVGTALFLWTGSEVSAPAGIRNLSITNVIATAQHACFIGGSPSTPIEGLRIHNMKLTIKGSVDGKIALDPPDPVARWLCPGIPHAFYIRHARDISLVDVEVAWGQAHGPWRSAVRATDVHGLTIANLIAAGYGTREHAAVHLTDVQDVSLHGCHIPSGQRLLLCDGLCSSVFDQ